MNSLVAVRYKRISEVIQPLRSASTWERWKLDPRDAVPEKLRTRLTKTYLQPKSKDLKYKPRLFSGGVLPRPKYYDEPVKMPEYKPKDMWTPYRAYFGQNDYIDILGDGSLKPRDFFNGPSWSINAKSELQQVSQLLNDPAAVAWFEEFEPTRLKNLRKRHKYLLNKSNRRPNIRDPKYRDHP